MATRDYGQVISAHRVASLAEDEVDLQCGGLGQLMNK
jgi:hypothetical protein